MKRIIIILLAFAFISSSGYAQEKAENTTKPDTITSVNDTSFSRGNIFTINPFQMIFYGEYQVGWEKEITKNFSYVFGIGFIYRTINFQRSFVNTFDIPYAFYSDSYKGFHMYIGIKQYKKNYFTTTNIFYIKYEIDNNFIRFANIYIDRFYGFGMGGGNDQSSNQTKVTREKFVLGYKFLLGIQNKKISKILSNFYTGAGVHIKYLVFSPYQLDGEIHNDSKLFPELSIHLGFTIGYRTR